MPLRPPAGFISAFYNPLQVPNAPTGVSASAGDAQATVSFTAPTNVGGGAITGYGAAAVKTSDGTTLTNTGASSPITVTGLTNGSAYTMNVWAINSFGPSPFGTSGSVSPAAPISVFAGGVNFGVSTTYNVIDYVTITTIGNATDFGDLLFVTQYLGACSSSTRGLFAGGNSANTKNLISYITFSTTGNAVSFGNLTLARNSLAGCSNSTRGVFAGGIGDAGESNVIDYVTIATTGNATDFGDLTAIEYNKCGLASTTRGVFAGGNISSVTNIIEYITIASVGNAVDFGDLYTGGLGNPAGCSSSTRGLINGGVNSSNAAVNVIQYITISSTGNSLDFGDLTQNTYLGSSASSEVRGLFGGGDTGSATNVISYSTIASLGNATDFGDLTFARVALAACSNGHGGL